MHVRLTLGLVLLLASSATAFGQNGGLEAKYQAKLKKEFMTKISWVQSLEKAQEMSKETGKPIFGYFTRSYAP